MRKKLMIAMFVLVFTTNNFQMVALGEGLSQNSEDNPDFFEEQQNQELITDASFDIVFEQIDKTKEFISTIGEEARIIGKENNLYASVMIAQAILESDSGSSILAQEPYNNLFGIKGEYADKFVEFSTWEEDEQGNSYHTNAFFRVYSSIKESFDDYSILLKEGLVGDASFYRNTWKNVALDYEQATQELVGTYATDRQYNKKLNALIETYDLTQYDEDKAVLFIEDNFEPYNAVNYDAGNSYAWGNCTQYVYNRITQLGGYIDLTMGNGQDWGITGKNRGYEVCNKPKVGTAVSFSAGVLGADPTYGHVAFVEKINEDNSILISEMNVQGLNVISTRIIDQEYVELLEYITPK